MFIHLPSFFFIVDLPMDVFGLAPKFNLLKDCFFGGKSGLYTDRVLNEIIAF